MRFDNTLPHGRMTFKGSLNFSKFDAETPDLYLMIYSSKQPDIPIGEVAGKVACPVEGFI